MGMLEEDFIRQTSEDCDCLRQHWVDAGYQGKGGEVQRSSLSEMLNSLISLINSYLSHKTPFTISSSLSIPSPSTQLQILGSFLFVEKKRNVLSHLSTK